MTDTSQQQVARNLIILAEKVLNCTPDEKSGENVYRVKWFDNLIPESKMKTMFPDLLQTFKDENGIVSEDAKDDTDEKDSRSKHITKTIRVRKTKGRYSCGDCDEFFDKHYLLEQHTVETHPETLKYPCKFCHNKFQTDSELNWHMLVHQTSCNDMSSPKNRLILPKPSKETHDASLVISCKCCKRFFNTEKERDAHVVKKKEEARASAKVVKALDRVKCDLCNKVVTRKRLESHKTVYHFKNGKFPCAHCEKRFISERDLHRHSSVHDEEAIQAKKNKVECDICGKVLTKVRLENHKLRFHFTKGEYACKNCGKVCPHLLDLDWHLSNECPGDLSPS